MTYRSLAAAVLATATLGVAVLTSGAVAMQAAAIAPLTLRSGPSADYALAGQLGAGAIVNVLWCGMKGNWCLIQRHETQGWVSAVDLKAVSRESAATDTAAVFPSMPAGHTVGKTPAGGGGGVSMANTTAAAPPTVHMSNIHLGPF